MIGPGTTRIVAYACMALCIPAFALADGNQQSAGEGNEMISIKVTVGDVVLSATLDDTPAARDFARLLPLELTLEDYHGTEMVADLGRKLDTTGAPASYKPQAGDITQYSPWSNLAIFTKPFADSRGLIRLGAFDEPIDVLTGDSVRARFEKAD